MKTEKDVPYFPSQHTIAEWKLLQALRRPTQRLPTPLLLGTVLAVMSLQGEDLPTRLYTTADGLAQNSVQRIKRDSHGQLWFATNDGISLYNGYEFKNFRTDDGLPHRAVSDLLETSSGEYWIATAAGVSRYYPKRVHGQARFVNYALPPNVASGYDSRLYEFNGTLLYATNHGLFRLCAARSGLTYQSIGLGVTEEVHAVAREEHGVLWIAGLHGLYRLTPEGEVSRFDRSQALPANDVFDVVFGDAGDLWVGTDGGLCRVQTSPTVHGKLAVQTYGVREGLLNPHVLSVLWASTGEVWVGTGGGVYVGRRRTTGDFQFKKCTNDLSSVAAFSVAEDSDGNIWVGLERMGAMRVVHHGFSSFSSLDGLRSLRVQSLLETRKHEILALTGSPGSTLEIFDGQRFHSITPYLPRAIQTQTWGAAQIALQDHEGEWWLATGDGVLRYPKTEHALELASTRPKALYTVRDGLPTRFVLRVFEDSRGDLWIGGPNGLSRWERRSSRIAVLRLQDQARLFPHGFVVQPITEDRLGSVWIGFYPFGLGRYRHGELRCLTELDGVPPSAIQDLLVDRTDRLWIASNNHGLLEIDDVSAERPVIRAYTRSNGLSSDQIFSVAEDNRGGLFVAGGGGVDRLDPATGRVRHFSSEESMPPALPHYILHDSRGGMWFASVHGLSRYVPGHFSEDAQAPSRPLIRRLRVAGTDQPISDFGESEVPKLNLSPQQDHLEIEFASTRFRTSEVLQYQYQLEGAEGSWSVPSGLRRVNYAHLGPSEYKFRVRALNGDRAYSPTTEFTFGVAAPVWRRPWFVAIAALVFIGLLYGWHQFHVQQVLAIEQIRTRLAADLHDEIGAGLSEIAINGEITREGLIGPPLVAAERISQRARELRQQMADIVWSIDPRRDDLGHVIRKIRQVAFSSLEINGCEVDFRAPEEEKLTCLPVSPELRGHLLSIAKEAISNCARHSGAKRVIVGLSFAKQVLRFEVADDGCGFVAGGTSEGSGLQNMAHRARELRGQCAIESRVGCGTRITVLLPFSR